MNPISQPPLRHLRVELTSACPNACGYCYMKHLTPSAEATLSRSRLVSVLEEALDLGLETVSFTGGEPLSVYRELKEVVSLAHSHGLKVGLLTSGRGLTRQRLDVLRRCGLSWVRMSIDCDPLDVRTSERLGRRLDWAIPALTLLRKADMPIILRPTATRQNASAMAGLVRFAADQGVRSIEVQPYMPCGKQEPDEYYQMPPSLHLETAAKLMRMRVAYERDVDVILYPGWFEFLSPEYLGGNVRKSNCGRSFLFLDSTGRLKTCAMSRRILSLPTGHERSLREIWQGDPYLVAMRDISPSGICAQCQWFETCKQTWCPAVNTILGIKVNAPTPVCPRVMLHATSGDRYKSEEMEAFNERDSSEDDTAVVAPCSALVGASI